MRVQGRSTKIKSGRAIDDVTQTRGTGGMTPRKIFEMLIFCEYFWSNSRPINTSMSMIKCNIDQQALTAGKTIKCHVTGYIMY